MVLESLGQEMLDLIKDCIAKSMVFGRNAKSKKYGHGGSVKPSQQNLELFVAKSRKSGRSRNARFDCGFESIDDYASRVVDDTKSIR